jgi:hypothetical protein
MNNSDVETLVEAVGDAKRILGEYSSGPQPLNAALTLHRLIAVLDRDDVVQALDRIKRRRNLRLVD